MSNYEIAKAIGRSPGSITNLRSQIVGNRVEKKPLVKQYLATLQND
jgi:DNA-binding CsgD family transcriptional regulator